jgi:tRNA (cytidine32/uridine32-2'-O)-methyltransferase
MACHGLTDLRIVGSPGSAFHPDAVRTSSGEEHILHAAREFESMEPALADCTYALAFSRRARDPGQRVLDLPEAAPRFASFASNDPTGGRIALVFGCESQGLSREETFHCSHVVRIPLPGPLLSLNLSHAVAIALYALYGGAPGGADLGKDITEAIKEGAAPSTPGRVRAADPASQDAGNEVLSLAESERILTAVIDRLAERGQFRPAKAEAQVEYLRILWQRLQPTRREVEFLAGLLKKLSA